MRIEPEEIGIVCCSEGISRCFWKGIWTKVPLENEASAEAASLKRKYSMLKWFNEGLKRRRAS
jgi:hypothetical protein